MAKILVFDIWGSYGHYKKIYATTSALTYPIPFKTAIYGFVGAVIGLDKYENAYLNDFQFGSCKIGIQLQHEPTTQRIHTNFSPEPGPIRSNRKPTLLELLRNPKYRIFFTHENDEVYQKLKMHLDTHTSIYTPCMGLANMLANFEYIGEFGCKKEGKNEYFLNGVIPQSNIIELNPLISRESNNEIVQVGMYALEMDTERNVTKRDSVLFDRKNTPIRATVNEATHIENYIEPDFYTLLF